MEDPTHSLLRREANLIASRQPHVVDEEKDADLKQTPSNTTARDTMVTSKSRGVFDMEMLASRLNVKYKIALYTSFTLLAYTLSLGECASDYLMRYIDGWRADQATNRTYLTTVSDFSAMHLIKADHIRRPHPSLSALTRL